MSNGIELQRELPYFDRDILVTLLSTTKTGISTDDSKVTTLTFRIIPGTKQAKSLGHTEKVIHFEFSNEDDPYFLYLLDVCESDFHQLKRDQSILVEFNVFPTKLIELLDLCTPSNLENQPPSNVSSAFTAKLDETTGVFSIIESNMFKQITHISLQLRTGNDASIKAYLASRLSHTLASHRRLSQDLGKCQLELESEKQSKLTVSSELQELRSLREIDTHTLQARHREELSRVLMIAAQEQDAVRVVSEERNRATQLQLETLRAQSAQRISQLELQLSDISQARSVLDFNSKDQLKELVAITTERDRLSADVEKLTAYKVNSEEIHLKLERDLAKATSKIEALQFQVQDKDELVAKSQALQRASDDARVAVEDKLKLFMESNDGLQEKIRDLSNEIAKGNQIISTQQQDIRQLRDKIRMNGEVIRRQEATVTEVRAMSASLERELTAANTSLQSVRQQSELHASQADEARRRLSESAKLVASNQEIIAYLNEELNKWHLGMSSAKPVELSSRVRTHSNIVSPMSADKSVSVLLAQTAKYTDGKFIPDSSIHASASKRKDLSEYTGRYNHSATISALTNTMDKTRVLPFASPSRLNPTEALGRRVPSDDSAKKYEQRYSQQHEQQYIYNDEQFQQHPQQQINKQSEYKREGSSTRVSKDLEIYMKGMRNLGLTEESLSGLEELDLSFDEPNVSAQHPYSTHSVSNMHSSRAKEYYQQEEQGSNDFSHSNLDVLEAMDYYSTNSGVLPVGSNRVTH